MFDAKKLLDALVGSAAAGSHGKPADAGLGNMLNDVLGQFTGGAGAGGNIAEKAKGYLNTPQGNMATSAVIGGLAGLLVGLPALRVRGYYLAIVTLAFVELM